MNYNLTTIIDQALARYGNADRDLVSATEICDLLLDIRSMSVVQSDQEDEHVSTAD